MSLTLYSHPFSSYAQKVLIALWENETPFTYRNLEEPDAEKERAAQWLLGRFPVLVDDGRTIAESSIIIEHLDLHHPGAVRFLPDDRGAALEVRFMDRFFDNFVMTPMQKSVSEALRGARADRQEEVLAEARKALDAAYGWLEERLSGRTWAAGETFTMADCAAARRSSLPTGFTKSARTFQGCGNIVRAYCRGPLSRAPSKRPAPTVRTFRLVRPIATDQSALRASHSSKLCRNC